MIEKKYRITVDKTTQLKKPIKEEIKKIHQRLINAEETTIPEFMEFIDHTLLMLLLPIQKPLIKCIKI